MEELSQEVQSQMKLLSALQYHTRHDQQAKLTFHLL